MKVSHWAAEHAGISSSVEQCRSNADMQAMFLYDEIAL